MCHAACMRCMEKSKCLYLSSRTHVWWTVHFPGWGLGALLHYMNILDFHFPPWSVFLGHMICSWIMKIPVSNRVMEGEGVWGQLYIFSVTGGLVIVRLIRDMGSRKYILVKSPTSQTWKWRDWKYQVIDMQLAHSCEKVRMCIFWF